MVCETANPLDGLINDEDKKELERNRKQSVAKAVTMNGMKMNDVYNFITMLLKSKSI